MVSHSTPHSTSTMNPFSIRIHCLSYSTSVQMPLKFMIQPFLTDVVCACSLDPGINGTAAYALDKIIKQTTCNDVQRKNGGIKHDKRILTPFRDCIKHAVPYCAGKRCAFNLLTATLLRSFERHAVTQKSKPLEPLNWFMTRLSLSSRFRLRRS